MGDLGSDGRRYLTSKKTVDDRALNQGVVRRLEAELRARGARTLRVLEVGAGLGTMVARLVDWGLLRRAEYRLLDVDAQLLEDARVWLAAWARQRGFEVHLGQAPERALSFRDETGISVSVLFIRAEVGALLDESPPLPPADLLVANAFLDLVDVPQLLPRLFDLCVPGGLYWFTINYDGESIFLPEHPGDAVVVRAYHRSMDERIRYGRPAGESKTGRHLFAHLHTAGTSVLAAGASDWVVHGVPGGGYEADEAFFLGVILDTIETELGKRPAEVDPGVLRDWVAVRRRQVTDGHLIYLAHQLDFVGHAPTAV